MYIVYHPPGLTHLKWKCLSNQFLFKILPSIRYDAFLRYITHNRTVKMMCCISEVYYYWSSLLKTPLVYVTCVYIARRSFSIKNNPYANTYTIIPHTDVIRIFHPLQEILKFVLLTTALILHLRHQYNSSISPPYTISTHLYHPYTAHTYIGKMILNYHVRSTCYNYVYAFRQWAQINLVKCNVFYMKWKLSAVYSNVSSSAHTHNRNISRDFYLQVFHINMYRK